MVAGGAFVVAANRTQLPAELPVRDQGFERGVPVEGEQAADPGVLGVVFLPCRTAPARDQVRVDGNDGEPGVDQRLDQQTVAGLQHNPDLGRIRFQPQHTLDQRSDPGRSMVDTELLDHPILLRAQGDVMEIFRPVDTDSQHLTSIRHSNHDRAARRTGKALRRADEPVLAGPHPPGRQAFAGARQGRRLISVLKGQAPQALPAGIPVRREGRAISACMGRGSQAG